MKQLLAEHQRYIARVKEEGGEAMMKDGEGKGLKVNVYTVNEVWLYSVMWCMGVHSVTTNEVAMLSALKEPLWVFPRASYVNWALLAESLSIVVVAVGLYCYQKSSRRRFVSASGDMVSTALFWQQ